VAPDAIIKGEDPAGSSVEPTTAGLEKAILSVKEKITIPEDYSQFNYYFYDTNSYSDAYWSFSWSNPQNYSMIQVNCDANYHITYFYQYNASEKIAGVSKYLKKEIKPTADKFINRLLRN
jgi:hypothetical protein